MQGCLRPALRSSIGAYPQHVVVVRGALEVCDEHPHPVPPLDFTVASWAQHALTPAGAGPPQQLPGCVFRDSSELLVVWLVFMPCPPCASSPPAFTPNDGDDR
jgi:hypothetical protein